MAKSGRVTSSHVSLTQAAITKPVSATVAATNSLHWPLQSPGLTLMTHHLCDVCRSTSTQYSAFFDFASHSIICCATR